MTCPVCGTEECYRLPVPSAHQAILSDGSIIPQCLAKAGCDVCGAAFHASPPDSEVIAAFFGDAYILPLLAPVSARKRATAYANWLGDVLGDLRDATVLELGASSGLLLEALGSRYPGMRGLGLEPAAPVSGIDLSSDFFVRRGRMDALKVHETDFDLIVAINVIEHVPDPAAFLEAAAARLGRCGRIAIVCPDGANAGEELLFYDHVISFTPKAFSHIAEAAGLHVSDHQRAPAGLGSFQLFVLSAVPGSSLRLADAGTALRDHRTAHLAAWRDLDVKIAARVGEAKAVAVFGSGQTAALLRAYAPMLWRRVAILLVDEPGDAWPLGRLVQSYRDLKADPAMAIVVAVSPGGQSPVATRLSAHGHRAITWDDLFPGPENMA